MELRSLKELQTADELSLAFGPLGLGGRMRPEEAAKFQQHQIMRIELADQVAEGTRRTFERLRNVYAYGVLCYDVYTLVGDAALLAFEQALRDRFMEWCTGTVTFRWTETGRVDSFPVTSYEDVTQLVKKLRRERIKLMVGDAPIEFNGMLDGLRRWARATELLRGRRSRAVESALATLRNHVAHPTHHQVGTPVEAARTLTDLAEVINQLWGRPTPGGRHYPAPLHREVAAMSWNAEGNVRLESAEALRESHTEEGGYEYVLIRAFLEGSTARRQDAYWAEFDSRYETTQYPTDYLWGPGTREEALTWLEKHGPAGDSVDFVNRVFLLREAEGQILPPMRPEVAAGLPDDERGGIWYTVRADFPQDAFAHVRSSRERGSGHARRPGDCGACSVELLGSGDHCQALRAAEAAVGEIHPVRPPAVRSPHALFWPDRP